MVILNYDPVPQILEGHLEGSLNPCDCMWGYSDEQKSDYAYYSVLNVSISYLFCVTQQITSPPTF